MQSHKDHYIVKICSHFGANLDLSSERRELGDFLDVLACMVIKKFEKVPLERKSARKSFASPKYMGTIGRLKMLTCHLQTRAPSLEVPLDSVVHPLLGACEI